MRRSQLLTAIVLVAALFTLVPGATAQETSATIRGTVVDATGSPVADAKIEVLDNRTGNLRTFTSNADGVFLATRLAPGGPYTVIVDDQHTREVPSISVADIYTLKISTDPNVISEVLTVTASGDFVEVATGPAATFDNFQLETTVAFNRDILDAYGIDPRINIDNGERGFEVNCAGKHPRFNSVTLDGVGQNDRFGLNTNGYSTATGMPFPYDAIAQLAVELAPADVTYGGFSACTINAVTKSGTNDFSGNLFWEHTDEGLKGDSLGGDTRNFGSPAFDSDKIGATFGGRILADKLHFFSALEQTESPRFLAHGYAGSGNGVERPWFSQSDHDRIVTIANDLYGYDPGGQPGDGVQEEDKQMLKLDWNVNPSHNLSGIYNYYDGFQLRGSDSDNNEFEFASHFYVKGAESATTTLRLSSQWTDSFSTELFWSDNYMDDSQVTVGPGDFGDFQISIGGRTGTVYLGADDSRQANSLSTDTSYLKLSGQLLRRRHVLTAGYEAEDNEIFNIFVQHSRGGEWDFFDDSPGNPAACAALTAQGRFDDPTCSLSGIDRFELGRPSRVYYGSGGGSNDPNDAAASFGNVLHSFYLQDEIFLDELNMTVAVGLRYETFTSDDRPTFNQAFTDANGGLRNDTNLDGLSLLMPRLGIIWSPKPQMSLRASLGRFAGGNPNVWVSNAWSNDGVTNVQVQTNYFDCCSVFDGTIPLTGGQPGRDVPQSAFDQIAATTLADGNTRNLVLIDPNYDQPYEDKLSLGLTWRFLNGYQVDFDYLHTEAEDSALYVDASQDIVGMTAAGAPIYAYVRGSDNFMLTNSSFGASSDILSAVVRKRWDSGLDFSLGYAYTDGEDVSAMTSFVAFSNFDNLALNDINNPRPGASNYVVPHRLSLRASLGREFFGNYETRFTLFAFYQEGQPGSFTMSSDNLEGGRRGRHRLYVPTGPDDPNVVFGAGFDQAGFFAWVDQMGFGPGFVPRNSTHANWTDRVDIGVHQDFPLGLDRLSGRFFVRVYNFMNLLGDGNGKVWNNDFFTNEAVDPVSINAAGQYVFGGFRAQDINDLEEFRSLWEARFGFEIRF